MSDSSREKSGKVVNAWSTANELYNDAIGMEAFARGGDCEQLKGIVHELLYRDKLNFGPDGLISGNVTRLTRNPRAHGADLVTVDKDGHVRARYQLKDCTSKSGIRKTLEQTRSGKYRNTRLMGTKETKGAYDAAKSATDKCMDSTGISSKRTGRIADNVGVRCRDSQTILNNIGDIAECAGSSAVWGAAGAAAATLVGNFSRYCDGVIDGPEYAAEVVCGTVTGAAAAGVTTAGALLVKEGLKTAGKSVGCETLKRFAGSNVGTAVAFGAVEMGKNVYDFATGEIDGGELAKKTISTTAGVGGGLGGAGLGAAIGTAVLPGVGTAIGALVGGFGGSVGARGICDAISDFLFD